MPTASNEQRALMEKWFGDAISEYGPMTFLESHGYILLPNWCWRKPVPHHNMSDDEWECLKFLVDEWDFGGIVDDTKGS